MTYTAPLSYNLAGWARQIVTPPNDAVLMLLGNSLACDTASTPSIGRGIQRTWRPANWSGRGTRALNGPPSWSSLTTTEGVGTVASLAKTTGWAATGRTGLFPVTCYSLRCSADFVGTPTLLRNALMDSRKQATVAFSAANPSVGTLASHGIANDGIGVPIDLSSAGTTPVVKGRYYAKYVSSSQFQLYSDAALTTPVNVTGAGNATMTYHTGAFDWADGAQVRGRLLYHADEDSEAVGSGGLGMLRFDVIGTRGVLGGESNVGVSVVASDASVGPGLAQTKYADVDCGSGASIPGIKVIANVAGNEDEKWALFGAAMYYRGSAEGVREPGLVFYDMATGGDNAEDIADLFADGVIPLAYTTAYMEAMFWPTHVLVYAPFQNQTSAEGTDFGNGSYAVAKANLLAILDGLFSACDAAGKPRPKVCIDVGHHTGYTAAAMELRAKACYEAARERNCAFLNTFALTARNPVGLPSWFTNPPSDDVHNGVSTTAEGSGNGESYIAGVMWSFMAATVDAQADRASRFQFR